MEMQAAITALSALGHEGRLTIFRLLVQAGPAGLAAGEVARRLGIQPSTLTANLNILARADLVRSHREGRSIVYSADFPAMTGLLGYLMADCCNGSPEVCLPLNQLLSEAAACDGTCLEPA